MVQQTDRLCLECRFRKSSRIGVMGRRGLRTALMFSLLLLPFAESQVESPRCPYGGQLALRPAQPFIFVRTTSRLCCQANDVDGLSSTGENIRLELSCSPNSSVILGQAIQSASRNPPGRNIHGSNTKEVCVDVTALTSGGVFKCQVQGQPHCHATQHLTVDDPLPSPLGIKCLTYGNSNVTCSVPNLPRILHQDRVTTQLTWKQVDDSGVQSLSASTTKLCSSWNNCVLTRMDGIMFGLPLTFNISVKMDYETGLGDHDSNSVVTTISEWLTFKIDAHVKLEPLRAAVVDKTNTTIKLTWQKQFAYFGDKTVRISYSVTGETNSTLQHEVSEVMDLSFSPMEFVLYGLQPSTTYVITLESRLATSDVWSDPFLLTASTN